MPKPKKNIPPLALEEETPLAPNYVFLELKDRERLTDILNDPVFVQAWNNAKASRPSPFTGGLNSQFGNTIANNRLHEMRGWMLCEAALISQTRDPKIRANVLRETYPDSAVPGGVSQ